MWCGYQGPKDGVSDEHQNRPVVNIRVKQRDNFIGAKADETAELPPIFLRTTTFMPAGAFVTRELERSVKGMLPATAAARGGLQRFRGIRIIVVGDF